MFLKTKYSVRPSPLKDNKSNINFYYFNELYNFQKPLEEDLIRKRGSNLRIQS